MQAAHMQGGFTGSDSGSGDYRDQCHARYGKLVYAPLSVGFWDAGSLACRTPAPIDYADPSFQPSPCDAGQDWDGGDYCYEVAPFLYRLTHVSDDLNSSITQAQQSIPDVFTHLPSKRDVLLLVGTVGAGWLILTRLLGKVGL